MNKDMIKTLKQSTYSKLQAYDRNHNPIDFAIYDSDYVDVISEKDALVIVGAEGDTK